MRFGLVLLLVGLPGAAMATEDRYGPSRRPDPALASAVPAPGARSSGYAGPTLSWTGKPSTPPQAAAVQTPPSAALPVSLYDSPAPSSQASTPPASPARAGWIPPTAAPVEAPASPVVAASNPWGSYKPRAYSVVREYGGTPDRIPAPPPQSAYTGPEVSLIPGLLGGGPTDDPAGDADQEPDDNAAKRPAREKK